MLKATRRSGRWYSRRAFARVRKLVLARDNFLCQLFLNCTNKRLHVHHVYPERWVRRWMPGADPHCMPNLLTVCNASHAELTAAERHLYSGNFLEFRRLVEPLGITAETLASAYQALEHSCKKVQKSFLTTCSG